jgi:hypothetical protein
MSEKCHDAVLTGIVHRTLDNKWVLSVVLLLNGITGKIFGNSWYVQVNFQLTFESYSGKEAVPSSNKLMTD